MGNNKKGKKTATKKAPEKNEKQLSDKDLDGVAGGSLNFTAPATGGTQCATGEHLPTAIGSGTTGAGAGK
jgi:hypothetical protein